MMKNTIIIGAILLATWYFFFKKKAVSSPGAQAINSTPGEKEIIQKVNDFLIAPEPSLVNPAQQTADNIKNLVERPIPIYPVVPYFSEDAPTQYKKDVFQANIVSSGITDEKILATAMETDVYNNQFYSLAEKRDIIEKMRVDAGVKFLADMASNKNYMTDGTNDRYVKQDSLWAQQLNDIYEQMAKYNSLIQATTQQQVAQIEIDGAKKLDDYYNSIGIPNPNKTRESVQMFSKYGEPIDQYGNVIISTPVVWGPVSGINQFSNIIDQSQLQSLAGDPFTLKKAEYYQNDSLLF